MRMTGVERVMPINSASKQANASGSDVDRSMSPSDRVKKSGRTPLKAKPSELPKQLLTISAAAPPLSTTAV